MDLDLSDDQVALRDGIAALLEGRFPIDRVRDGLRPRDVRRARRAGVFSLRADGFALGRRGVVFEQLGRALRARAARVVAPRRTARSTASSPGSSAPPARHRVVEHLDALDALVVLDDDGDRARRPDRARRREPLDWPLDPLTPVHRVDALPAGERVGRRRRRRPRGGAAARCSPPRSRSGWPTRCTELAVAYAKEREQFDRPIGSFQAIKHMLRRHARAHRGGARRGARGGGARSTTRTSATLDRAVVGGAKLLAGEAAIANGEGRRRRCYGGMGFTWEVDVHLYLKRAWVLDTVFGTPAAHADALACRLGMTDASAVRNARTSAPRRSRCGDCWR